MGTVISYEALTQIAAGAEEITSLTFESVEAASTYAAENLGWTVLQGSGEASVYAGETIANAALTGGAEAGTTIYQVVETAGGGGAIEAAGAGVGISVGSAVAAVLAGCGIGLALENLNPEFWTRISNKLFGTNAMPEGVLDYFMPGVWKNDRYYIAKDMIENIIEASNELNMFYPYGKTVNKISEPAGTTMRLTSAGMNSAALMEQSKIYYNASKTGDDILDVNYASRTESIEAMNRAISSFRALNPGLEPNGLICSCAGSKNLGRYDYFYQAVYINQDSDVHIAKQSQSGYALALGSSNPDIKFSNAFYAEYWSDGTFRNIYELSASLQLHLIYNEALYSSNNLNQANSWNYNIYPPGEGSVPITDHANIYDPEKDLEVNFPAWTQGKKSVANTALSPRHTTEFFPIVVPEVDPYRFPEQYPTYDPYKNPDVDPQTHTQEDPDPDPIPTPWTDPYSVPEYIPVPSAPYVPFYDPPEVPVPGTPKVPTTPVKPSGDTPAIPVIPPIGGSANALFTVYNPSESNLNSLAGVLWSQNFITQIVQMFSNNPMDAIISLHLLYATPSTSGTKNIKLGYLDTGIAAPYVNNQYINVNCGTITVPEYFGDARDYSPFTKVHIYLPFIGIRTVKTEDLIGSNVTIDYKVDVFTGTVLCNININKPNVNQILYTFEGNCAVNLPLTGADKSRQLSAVANIITGAVTGGAGGAMIGGALSLANGGFKSDIQHQGTFSGNAGAMGAKKPYIIINRSIPSEANNYNSYYGFPANKTVNVSTCQGFTRFKSIHVDGVPNATDWERAEIERLLKEGVIV